MMKKITTYLILILFAKASIGQIVPSKNDSVSLKKGIYQSYDEFKNNSPSITAAFKTHLIRISKKDTTVIEAKFQNLDTTTRIRKFWGFCDGENVFVNYSSGLLAQHYWKIRSFGKNPYFYYVDKTSFAVGPAPIQLATLVLATTAPPVLVLKFINKEGKVKKANRRHIKKLLSDDPALFHDFKSIKVQTEKDWKNYINLYNTKHP